MAMIVFLGIWLIGCGEEVPTAPGEEVVTDKWVDPKDIGKDYPVGEVKTGDTVTLSTGEQYTVGILDFPNVDSDFDRDIIHSTDEGEFIETLFFKVVPDEEKTWELIERIERGYIVPDGDPIVGIFLWEGILEPFIRVRKEDNVKDRIPTNFYIRIDRALDYNLPIYVEYQEQYRIELGSEVRRIRYLTVVFAGQLGADGIEYDAESAALSVGDGLNERSSEDVVRASIRILPYTEMNNIDLPVELDISKWDGARTRPLEDRIIPEGHKFRPYRIHSSSFLMTEMEIERNW